MKCSTARWAILPRLRSKRCHRLAPPANAALIAARRFDANFLRAVKKEQAPAYYYPLFVAGAVLRFRAATRDRFAGCLAGRLSGTRSPLK